MSILSQDHDGRHKCVNAGTCDLGCAAGAKGGTNFTYWPMLENAGVELRSECRVREILVDQLTGFATGVLYHGADGQLHEQKAELVVVACNGVGTPRLLLKRVFGFAFEAKLLQFQKLLERNLPLAAKDCGLSGELSTIGTGLC